MLTDVIVCGSREAKDYFDFRKTISYVLLKLFYKEDLVVHHFLTGCADGIDAFTTNFSKEVNIDCFVFAADWEKHGKAAGPIRNREIILTVDPKLAIVLAFPGGKGTKDMVTQAKNRGIRVIDVDEFCKE